jgi:hypothetical protein
MSETSIGFSALLGKILSKIALAAHVAIAVPIAPPIVKESVDKHAEAMNMPAYKAMECIAIERMVAASSVPRMFSFSVLPWASLKVSTEAEGMKSFWHIAEKAEIPAAIPELKGDPARVSAAVPDAIIGLCMNVGEIVVIAIPFF